MIKEEFFKTPIWVENKTDFLTSLTKASNKYIKEAKQTKEAKEYIKKFGDFGRSYHSTPLTFDNDFLDFRFCHHCKVLANYHNANHKIDLIYI